MSEIDVNTPQKAVHLDEGALNARYRGRVEVADAIGGFAQQAEGFEADMLKAKNAGIAADVDLKMRTARQTFLESLQNDPNQDTWQERASQTADSVQESISATHEGIAPAMRKQVDSAFKSWKGSLMVETQTMANIQTINRAWGKTKEDYQESLKDGQADHAMNLLQNAKSSKLADPAEIDQMERAIPKTIALNYISNGLQANPKQTTDLLRSGASLPANDQYGRPIVPSKVLSPKEMDQLLIKGRSETLKWQAGNAEQMMMKDADPDTGFIPEDTIRQSMASGNIAEQWGMNKIASQDRKIKAQKVADDQERKKGLREISAADSNTHALVSSLAKDSNAWEGDPESYQAELISATAAITDPAKRQSAINEVHRQYASAKKTGQTAEKPVEREIYKQGEQSMEQGLFKPATAGGVEADVPIVIPVFGKIWSVKKVVGQQAVDPKRDKKWQETATENEIAQAHINHARWQTQMESWFKTQKPDDPSLPEKAEKYGNSLMKDLVEKQVQEAMTKKPDALTGQRRKQNGVTFEFDGKDWNPVK